MINELSFTAFIAANSFRDTSYESSIEISDSGSSAGNQRWLENPGFVDVFPFGGGISSLWWGNLQGDISRKVL